MKMILFLSIMTATVAALATDQLPQACKFNIEESHWEETEETVVAYFQSSVSSRAAEEKCKASGYPHSLIVKSSFIPFLSTTALVRCAKKVAVDTATLKLEVCPKISSCAQKLFSSGQLTDKNTEYLNSLKTKYTCE